MILHLFQSLARHVRTPDDHPTGPRLEELTLTTNGSRLFEAAPVLAQCGVRRVNVSLDTLDADLFRCMTRGGDLASVLRGIEAALDHGLRVKINTVALRGMNQAELPRLMAWCAERAMDMTLIEVMPMGAEGAEHAARLAQYLPLDGVRRQLERRFTLSPLALRTGGPARYVRVEELGLRLGFITPLTQNFCESCNRVRVTATGRLVLCLGQEDGVDLRSTLRAHPGRDEPLMQAITHAITRHKPKGHDFALVADGGIPQMQGARARSMSTTGG